MSDVPAPREPDPPALTVVPAKRSGKTIIDRLHQDPKALVTATLDAVLHETKKARAFEKYLGACAELVFAYWCAKFDHPLAILDKKREQRLLARLRENGGNVSELLWVLDAAHKDDWTMGRDVHSPRKYDGIETIFRDRAKVESFAERVKACREGKPHPMARKYLGDLDPASLVA